MKSEPGKIVITAGQPGFIDGLKMGLKELGNLEAVIIRYDTTASAPNSSIDRSNVSSRDHCNLNFSNIS